MTTSVARALWFVLLLLVPIVSTLVFDDSPAIAIRSPDASLPAILLDALPAALLSLMLVALTRRTVLGLWLGLLVQALLYSVNGAKLANLATPLLPSDALFLGAPATNAHLLEHYLPEPMVLAATLFALVVVTAMLWWLEPALERWRALPRALLGGVCALALLSLIAGAAPWRYLYDAQRMGFSPWSPRSTVARAGLLGSLALFRLDMAGTHFTPDPRRARALLAQMAPWMRPRLDAPATPSSTGAPDIIVVQSESFSDPARLRGLDSTAALIPNFRALSQRATGGWMDVPTYGGGTIRTEFEILTGLPLTAFPHVRFPYMQIHRPALPGLVGLLRNQGYHCIAIHPNDRQFWNRAATFRAFGFDRFFAAEGFRHAPRSGFYVADVALTDAILKHLRKDGPPQFVFAISMEAHGPYTHSMRIDTQRRDALPTPPDLDPDARRAMQNYLYHLHDADHELGRLVTALQTRSRPTLVLFYGDHLPGLGPAYAQGFDDGRDATEQPVPWLLWSSTSAQAQRHARIPAWALPGLLIRHAKLRTNPWFALTQAWFDAPSHLRKQTETGWRDIAWLRLNGRFDALWSGVNGG